MADTSKPGQQGLVRKRSITPANQINILPRPSQPVEHDDDDMSMSVLVDRRDDNNKDDDDSDRDVIAAPPANISLRRPTSLVSFQTIPSVASGSTYQYTGEADNIDERDANDHLCVTEYVQDMYHHFRIKEKTTSARPGYMENQPHTNEIMRSILVDWLVDVHLKFKLVPETLYLNVSIIDRYLERSQVTRQKLQLVGVVALLIACKYEEIYPPDIGDLVDVCDKACTKKEIIQLEGTILKTLEYKITIPSAHTFLVRYLKAAHADANIIQLSCYILDGTLQSYKLLRYLPSQLAAAAVLIARKSVGRNIWSPTLLKYSSYCEEDIIPVAKAVLSEKTSASQELSAINKKYSDERYGFIASTPLDCDL